MAFYKSVDNLIYDITGFGAKKFTGEKLLFEKRSSINVFPDVIINEETTALSVALTRAFT